jgi:hypothetical protein
MLLNCFINYLYMRILKLTLGKIFFCKFSSSLCFLCETSGQTYFYVRTHMAFMSEWCCAMSGRMHYFFFPNVVLTADVRMGSFLGKYSRSFYFLPLAQHCIVRLFFSCCVFLVVLSRDFGILCTSLLIPSYFLWLLLFF